MDLTDLTPPVDPEMPVASAAARTRMRERVAELSGRAERPIDEHLGSPAPLHWSGLQR